ncbi:Hypothetical predicted protein [Olea europaea subsp. europaea]|uniref:Uncharacterized protein n=1 Tax=Olea europaea subsp. europaea TaxID=158383 RepID=A0A8S0V515_OLEEU|nr:Hypothetical predicted protein [Olea europaea subsp. europaea]
MGLPNKSNMLLSEQDFHATNCNFFQVHGPVKNGTSTEENQVKSARSLKIEVSSPGEVIKVEEEGDGYSKTPTSLTDRNKIRLKCPPAPRKPKSLPSTKRSSRKDQTILLDLASEIESLFPPALLKDLLSGKIKKVRKESGII